VQCFRRQKDKINPENDESRSINLSPSTSHKDLSTDTRKRAVSRVPHCHVSPILHCKSNESANSSNFQIKPSYVALIRSPSIHLERLLQTPPPESSLSTSTPILTRNSYFSDFPARKVKRPSSEQGISPNVPRRKILRDSVN